MTKSSSEPQEQAAKECKSPAGVFVPVVNRAKCEGKAACVKVCPYNVFELSKITDADFAALGPLAKLKSIVHGKLTVYTPNAEHCRACGLCVAVCPEQALTLRRA